VQGATALADLVGLYRTNGFIKRPIASDQLIREYGLVARELQKNHPRVAIALLYGINLQVRVQAMLRWIDGQATQRLVYLNGKLIESIRGVSGFAAKDKGDEELRSAALPESFELKQNYPNPFNPSTNIEFTLPVSSVVTLEVFNIMGQRVRTLVNEPLQAGVHQVVWNSCGDDGQRVASGVYFYRIQADQLASTRKMVLLK
jgi:methionine-rich copper-binding protein CopC